MAGLPSGTVTFLFTDIEGSTALWERDPAAMRTAVARHFVLLQNAITAHGGVLFKTVGDAAHAAFGSAAGAVVAAVDAQQALHAEPWALPEPLRVRMALHTGEVTPVDDDYAAPVLNRLSRLLAVGHGGQVLLAATTQHLVRGALPTGTALHDHGEHRLRDLQPEHIFHLIGAGLPTDFPPLRTLEHHPNNLPTPLTTFIGREQEVAAVQTLLTDDAVRLLTLTGPGGVGKTRLAVRAAAGLLETFPDGIFFVNLATLGDPRLVLPTIATVLGVREEGSLPLRDRLAAHLRDRRLLLILDNFEQLLEAAPLVSELLIEAPGLTVLVTSRSRLRLQGEREVTVPPLAAPAPDLLLVTVDSVAEYAAVRLFVDRARAARPDFTLTSENAAVVAAICARLDGLPLALELAASRVKLLRLPALLNRLERRLPLLTGGARDLPARQQTLRATIAWSYDLLTPDEQAVLRRLAVFVGGWTIEAAEAVVNPAGDLGLDVLEGIGALLDASLVQPVDESGDDPRFRMLETVREFGLERLIERGEEHAIRERHAAWFLDRAEHEWGVDVWGVGEIPALQQAEAEYPNLRAALAWLLDQRPEDALRLASNLTLFWWVQGQVPEASDWLHRALTKGTAAAADVRASALGAAARLAFAQGRAEEGVKLSEQSLALWDSLGADANSSPHYAVALFERGGSAYWAGNMEEAEHYFLRAQERFAALGMVMWQAATSAVYGGLTFDRGDLNRSEELHREALTVAQAEHNPVVTAFALSGLADVALARGDAQKAGSLWQQSLNLSWRLREMLLTPDKFVGLADVAAHQGNAALAAQLLGADQAQREASGLALSGRRAWFDHACAVAQASLGADGFQQAWDEGRTWSLERAVTEAQATTTSAMPSASTDPPRSPV